LYKHFIGNHYYHYGNKSVKFITLCGDRGKNVGIFARFMLKMKINEVVNPTKPNNNQALRRK